MTRCRLGRKRLDLKSINGGNFGWLQAVRPAPDKAPKKTAWHFNCTRCNRKNVVIETSSVVHMGQKSCGCYRVETGRQRGLAEREKRAEFYRRYDELRKSGMSNRAIARMCRVSRQSVDNYFTNKEVEKQNAVAVVPDAHRSEDRRLTAVVIGCPWFNNSRLQFDKLDWLVEDLSRPTIGAGR